MCYNTCNNAKHRVGLSVKDMPVALVSQVVNVVRAANSTGKLYK